MILSFSPKISEVLLGATSYHLWMGGIVVFFSFRIFTAVVVWEQFIRAVLVRRLGSSCQREMFNAWLRNTVGHKSSLLQEQYSEVDQMLFYREEQM